MPPEVAAVVLEGISVFYRGELDGGGARYGQDFVPFVERTVGRVPRLLEWCAGPGFIGFALLGRGLCDALDLIDVNPSAVDVCRETIRQNGLSNVSARVSDCFDAVPAQKWDLVVANPPHSGTDEDLGWGLPIIYQDPDWAIHRKFFCQVRSFLEQDGRVILQENRDVSSAEVFDPMIRKGDLRILDVAPCPADPHIYYLVLGPS